MSPGEGRVVSHDTPALAELDAFVDSTDSTATTTEDAKRPSRAAAGTSSTRTWLILGLLLAGVLHVFGASLWTRVNEIPLSAQFGLFELLPVPYWIGLGLVGCATALAVRERSEPLLVLTGVVLLALLAGTPNLFEPNPSNWDSYSHFSEAQLILATGHLPSVNVGQYSANWPGMFLLVAMLDALGGVPALTLITLHPFVAGGLTFLALFTFLRGVFPRPVAAPGAVLTSVFAVWAQYHLSPQSLGFVLALLLLGFLWHRGMRWRLASALLFGGLVVLHPTSTVLVLTILAVMCLLSPLWRRSSAELREDVRSLRGVTLLYGGVWFGWLYFRATATYAVASAAILARMSHLIFLPEQTVNVAVARTSENLLPVAPLVRLAAVGLLGLFGIVSLPFLLRKTEDRRLGWFLLSALLAIAGLAGLDLVAFGGQFYDRSLLVFAVLAPAMSLTGLARVRLPRLRTPGAVRRVLVAVLIVASVTAASTVYYQEAFNAVPDGSIAVSNFIQQVPPGSAVLDGMFPPPVWRPPATWTPYTGARFFTIYPSSPEAYAGTTPTYEVFDNTSLLWYEQWLGLNVYQSYTRNETSYSRIYDNGEATIYFVGG